MTKTETTIKIISTLAILMPILFGIPSQKTIGNIFRLFFVFLVVGFIIDLTSWYFIYKNNKYVSLIIFNFYSIIESSVFFWFAFQSTSSITLRRITIGMLMISSIAWIICFYLSFHILIGGSPSGIYVSLYEVIGSFVVGAVLLELLEKEISITTSPKFWILLGIFFYCFCSFFIMGFLETIAAQKLWFVSNIINIVTYIFYSIGLWHYRRVNES